MTGGSPPPPGLRGPNAEAGLRGPNAEAGLRGPNAEAGLRGPNAEAGLRGPNAAVKPGRRQARERALSLLYEAETKGLQPSEVLASLPLEPAPFATDLVAGVGEHQGEVDDLIRRFARGWALERMPALDRALARIGVYELLHRPDVPTGAVLSEAVELAGRYSTEESGRFVNGLLAEIAREVRPG